MKILVTNDDGFDAPGIDALFRICARLGQVVMVAPSAPQSGVGHAVTTSRPLELCEHGPDRYSLSGTPADCVRVALREVLPDADWVVAGINAGGNLGADAYTSGTLAAVREAALLGFSGLAVSQYIARRRPLDWEASALRATPVLETVFARGHQAGFYWNANLPHPAEPAGVPKVVDAPLDTSPMLVRYRREGDAFHWDGDYHGRPREAGSDVDICFSGAISLTRLPLRLH
jgi:5'-nucleotidase